ncbi:cilia- and flagella-associated protein 157 [Eucyclogobius newberryi]|uniref:cilia- and flagella-associated protein 157 n=1 Tax=Eucyclogobius newberryi TaxID=166745 RepID=UPI003B59C1E5
MSKKVKESGEKRGKKTTKKDTDSASEAVSEERERSFCLAQIRFLSEKLERYEQKCEDLEAQKKDLNLKHVAREKEKADIVAFLKRSLLEKDEEADRLSERLDSAQQDAQRQREEMQQQHKLQLDQLQHGADALTVDNQTLVEKLMCVEQFLNDRDQLMAKLDALKKQLSRQEEAHTVELHNRDMQALTDKDKWEKTLESHVAGMEAEVQRLVNQRLPETTSLALQQNKELKERFGQLSQHSQGLLGENTALKKSKTQLKLDVENLEQMLREVTRNNCIQKRVVQKLTEKCTALQTELNQCRQKHQQLLSLQSQSVDEMETLRQDQASVLKQCNKKQHDIGHLEAALQQERRTRSEMKSVIQKGCVILKEALMEVEVENSKERVDRWKLLMKKLLVVLEAPSVEEGIQCQANNTGRSIRGESPTGRV